MLFVLHFFKLYYHSVSGLAGVCRQVFHANYRWLLQAAGDQNNHQQVFAATASPTLSNQLGNAHFPLKTGGSHGGSGSVNRSVWLKPYKFSVIIFGSTLTNSSLFTHKRLLKKISPELLVSYIWQPKYPPCIHPLMLVLIRISLVEDKPSSASSAKTYSTLLFDMKHRASNQLACQTDGITASNDSRNCFINGSQHGGNCVQVRLIDEERNPAKEEENKWQVSAMRWKQD